MDMSHFVTKPFVCLPGLRRCEPKWTSKWNLSVYEKIVLTRCSFTISASWTALPDLILWDKFEPGYHSHTSLLLFRALRLVRHFQTFRGIFSLHSISTLIRLIGLGFDWSHSWYINKLGSRNRYKGICFTLSYFFDCCSAWKVGSYTAGKKTIES